ncbi:MAG: hypothetical protein DRO88_08060 [Promethearchaeia archaeon]|nr:MAG: hypothetical protein DRO88_08060 [Candidatus Lokiarchaeia archaeon]
MLENIFLISFNHINKVQTDSLTLASPHLKSHHSIFAYPDDLFLKTSPNLIDQIISQQKHNLEVSLDRKSFTEDFLYSNIKAIKSEDKKFLVSPLPYRHVLGLVFDLETDPFDYRNELVKLFLDYVLEKYFNRPTKNNKDTLLLTLFVDLRNYSHESNLFKDNLNELHFYRGEPYIKVFVFGIDNAGKSSLMRLLATGKFDENFFIPTRKFRITNITLINRIKLSCWDMPGQIIFREDWLRGAQASNILLFVLDVADTDRYSEAKKTFWKMVNLYDLQHLPVIFIVNKIDLLENPIDKTKIEQISHYFGLSKFVRRDIIVISTSLPTRTGIDKLKREISKIATHLLLVNGVKDPLFMAE